MDNWREFIFSEKIPFDKKVQEIYRYQYENNTVYRTYCDTLESVLSLKLNEPPLYPVRGFKEAKMTCKPGKKPELVFKSSGTEGMRPSRHPVADSSLYIHALKKGFRQFYKPENAVIWAYLPGYTDNPDSSLVWMVEKLVSMDESGLSGFLPLNEPLDAKKIKQVKNTGKQLIIFGAAFGLYDLAEQHPVDLPSDSIVIETGGMKTHKREIERETLHQKLAKGFNLDPSRIHSEYGMTELLSQAYSTGGPWFQSVPWMNVSVRNPENPAEELPPFSEGLIGIIDLANVHSCSFLLTGDRGLIHKDGRFKVLGRWNPRDLRGCNFLLYED